MSALKCLLFVLLGTAATLASAQGSVSVTRDESSGKILVTNTSEDLSIVAIAIGWECSPFPAYARTNLDVMETSWMGNANKMPRMVMKRDYLPLAPGKTYVIRNMDKDVKGCDGPRSVMTLFNDGSFSGDPSELGYTLKRRLATLAQIDWLASLLKGSIGKADAEPPADLVQLWASLKAKGNDGSRPKVWELGYGYLDPQLFLGYLLAPYPGSGRDPYPVRVRQLIDDLTQYCGRLVASIKFLQITIASAQPPSAQSR